ncbi:MAG: glycosyltransferase family 2 protein [Acidimicrobiales bacterium]
MRVGIVSWNTAQLLGDCLAALPAALDGVDAEVVVVDNASADSSAEVARQHAVQVVVNDRNLGYAVGMNQALEGSEAPLLLALNPDTIPAPGTLRRLVERFADHPHAGVLVPRLTDEQGRPQDSAHRFPGPLVPIVASLSTRSIRRSRLGRWLLLDGSGPHRGGNVDWAIGAVHLIRASALGGEKPYDERSFMYAEDLDLCWRLTQRGAPTVLAEDVTVAHVGNAAGAQAWGDERSVRFWTATYDVVRQRRSPLAARVAALGASLAGVVSILRTSPRAIAGGRRAQARRLLAVRRRELVVHLRTAVVGPIPSPTSPPAA